ncbi:RNA-directed DNA polymerase [Melioribacter sp. Ez-97]|uniref:RNA-directed DNA polymerase n=1 Tax=Melioribacter sp. Ez-97 TaxID=3423434 RepID=UPI003ED848BE
MKNVLDLTPSKAKNFFLKEESYINYSLPHYFTFKEVLSKIDEKINGKKLSDFSLSSASDYEDVNYQLFSNKDGKYAWRPFQIIHPALYVSLVQNITKKENWSLIRERFKFFRENPKIECFSIPMVSEEKKKTDKEIQIYTWWQQIEQRSLAFALEYKYILHTDITDCYGTIYTHSIPWALHTKDEAKKKENRNNKKLIGVIIDQHLRDMNYGQTNGIPQGSTLMDLIAEMVLGYIDSLLTDKIKEKNISEYHILRYRDDYRVFTNNPFEAEVIAKLLSEILTSLGMKLNAEKTKVTDNVIKSSVKPDKLYWIQHQRKTGNKQKWLIQLYLLGEQFPNSGVLDTQVNDFLLFLERNKRKDKNIETLISIISEIAFRNPRVAPRAIAIMSLFLKQIKSQDEQKKIIKKIHNKFLQLPNSSLLEIWFQRLYLKIDSTITYNELLSKKVMDVETKIWNSEWLKDPLKKIVEETAIIDRKSLDKTKKIVTKNEIKTILVRKDYY